jgi:hypothetical protein
MSCSERDPSALRDWGDLIPGGLILVNTHGGDSTKNENADQALSEAAKIAHSSTRLQNCPLLQNITLSATHRVNSITIRSTSWEKEITQRVNKAAHKLIGKT